MRILNIILLLFITLLTLHSVYGARRYKDNSISDDSHEIKNRRKQHEYKKYNDISNSPEDLSTSHQSYDESDDYVSPITDEEESSEEIKIMEYRRKGEKKKTLSDVIKEKRQKKQEKKKRFEKNVLRYFKDGKEYVLVESSEEDIVIPIRRRTRVEEDDCNSLERDCHQ